MKMGFVEQVYNKILVNWRETQSYKRDYNNTTTTPDINRNKDQGYIILLLFKKLSNRKLAKEQAYNPMGLIYSRD